MTQGMQLGAYMYSIFATHNMGTRCENNCGCIGWKIGMKLAVIEDRFLDSFHCHRKHLFLTLTGAKVLLASEKLMRLSTSHFLQPNLVGISSDSNILYL